MKINQSYIFSRSRKQFRALVTPCLSSCEPVKCDIRSYDNVIKQVDSYGRRRRRRSAPTSSGPKGGEEELIVMQTIKIMDTFNLNDTRAKQQRKQSPTFMDDLKCMFLKWTVFFPSFIYSHIGNVHWKNDNIFNFSNDSHSGGSC